MGRGGGGGGGSSMILKLFKSSRLTAVNNILFQTDFKRRKTGFIQSLEFFKNCEICPAISQTWKKSGK